MKRFILLIAALTLVTVTIEAYAQWAFLARKALGRVEQLYQEFDGHHQEVATVLLEAKAENIFKTAITILEKKPQITITEQNESTLTVKFSDDQGAMTLRVTKLSDQLSQLLLASIGGHRDISPAIEGVLRVCEEMGVRCAEVPS